MTTVRTILVADDDADVRQLVELTLGWQGFRVLQVADGSQALQVLHSQPVDLVILDLMMPVMNGWDTCRSIRQTSDVPVLMLTARGEEQDVVDGFSAGALDYVVKPFRPRELLARVGSLLDRRVPRQEIAAVPLGVLSFDGLAVDLENRQVIRGGRSLLVSPTSFKLLVYFLRHPGKTVSKAELLSGVWGYDKPCEDMNLVEAAVYRLRMELGENPHKPHYLKTVRGFGYQFGDFRQGEG